MSEKTVQKRRPRKDTQNRDYKCPCGKNYLSYPALYTHVKQKHGDEIDDYMSRVEKPKTKSLDRGRPKASDRVRATNNQQMTIEYSLLSILEILTIELTDIFRPMDEFKTRPFILIGNSTLSMEEVRRQLQSVDRTPQLQALLVDEPSAVPKRNLPSLAITFCRSLCKHFPAYVSSRFILFFSMLMAAYTNSEGYTLESQEEDINSRFFNIFLVDLFDRERERQAIKLWDNSQIYSKILQAFGNWMHLQNLTSTKIQLNKQQE